MAALLILVQSVSSLRTSMISLCTPATASLAPPVAAKQCWRPTIDDVDRISWGRPAKKKGTGSRGTPHRLNDEERTLYDFARRKGFVEIAGSGWRKQRSDAPLVNTFRSWCDARGHPAICVHKGSGEADEVIADLSPLRTPLAFEAAAAYCILEEPGGEVEFDGFVGDGEPVLLVDSAEGDADAEGIFDLTSLIDVYRDDPIYRCPMYAVVWTLPRSEAKQLAKRLAEKLSTAQAPRGDKAPKGRAKRMGAPNVKPGKSRRHGGYGIG